MNPLEVAENSSAASTNKASSAYVPPLQRTEGQPPPIAANGGLSYMSFDRDPPRRSRTRSPRSPAARLSASST